jgi:hypothetical protein
VRVGCVVALNSVHGGLRRTYVTADTATVRLRFCPGGLGSCASLIKRSDIARMTRSAALIVALLAAAALSAAASNPRLVERPLQWSTQGALGDVPIVDPPKRIAGYFKLNRTRDAHMFFFYYESRSKRSVQWTQHPNCSGICGTHSSIKASHLCMPALAGQMILWCCG